MKHRFLLVPVLLLLAMPAWSQTAAELEQIRAQLLQLSERVTRLEQENATLRAQVASPPSSAAPVAPAAVAASAQPAAKTADWPNRMTLRGDIRYRHDYVDDESQAKARGRDLLRARVALDAKANDKIQVGVGFATSENGNPRGANQTLDGEFSRKALDLDFAYFDWTIASGLHAIGGKMKTPFFRPGQSLFIDNDVNPEGLAFTYSKGIWFGSAYGFWVDENVPVNGTTPTDADTMMFGGQAGLKLPIGASNLTLAASYYDLAAAEGRRPFYNGSSNGNSVLGTGTAAVLAYDFRVINLGAEYSVKLGDLPLLVWADAAQNQAAELDTAYTIGTMVGRASDPKTWEAGLAYQVLEKDALFAQLIDSDFAGGVSDSEGWVFRAGYAPLRNWSINATYFLTKRNVDVGTETDFDRLMLDFNVRY